MTVHNLIIFRCPTIQSNIPFPIGSGSTGLRTRRRFKFIVPANRYDGFYTLTMPCHSERSEEYK